MAKNIGKQTAKKAMKMLCIVVKGICTSGIGRALPKLQNNFCHFDTNVAAANSDLFSGILESGVFSFVSKMSQRTFSFSTGQFSLALPLVH